MRRAYWARGILAASTLAVVSYVIGACGAELGSTVGSKSWTEWCKEGVVRYHRCRMDRGIDEATSLRTCVDSEPCVREIIRPDALLPYLQCEAAGECETECLSHVGSTMSSSPTLMQVQREIDQKQKSCGTEMIMSDVGDGPNMSILADAFWKKMEGCLERPCADAGSCMVDVRGEMAKHLIACATKQ